MPMRSTAGMSPDRFLPQNWHASPSEFCERHQGNGGRELVTEDELVGLCRGWDGTTEFELSNGEVWKQSAYRARNLHLVCPEIRVWRYGPWHWIEVEGAGEILPVRRIL